MLTEENRRYILNEYLRIIHIISDKDYQRRVWILGESSGSDFDEICCLFFGDIGDPILEHYKDFWITNSQYCILKKFRDRFSSFSDEHSYEPAFIDTPEWNEITEMAKEVLKSFNYEEKKNEH